LDLTVRIFFNAMPLGKASLVRIAQLGRIMTGAAELNEATRKVGVQYLKALDTFMVF